MQSTQQILRATAKSWTPQGNTAEKKQDQKQAVAQAATYHSPIAPSRREIPLADEKMQTSLSHGKSAGVMPLELDTAMPAMEYAFASPTAVNGAGVFTPDSGMNFYYQATPEAIYQDRLAHACHTYQQEYQRIENLYEFRINSLSQDAQQYRYTQESYDQAIADINHAHNYNLYTIAEGRKHEEEIARQLFLDAQHRYPDSPANTPPIGMGYQEYSQQTQAVAAFGMAPSGTSAPMGVMTMSLNDMSLTNSGASAHNAYSPAKKSDSRETVMCGLAKKMNASAPHSPVSDDLSIPTLPLPDTRTMLQRATSEGQTMTNSVANLVTPTTGHVLAQVPVHYSSLFEELRRALSAPGVKTSGLNTTKLLSTINNTIITNLYSEIIGREYGKSKYPSPTVILTVLYEIQMKADIKGRSHANKLGRILNCIKKVIPQLKRLRDSQKKSAAGVAVSEITMRFIALFNKIGILGAEALRLYEASLGKSVQDIDVAAISRFFETAATENNKVFEFYIQQTDKSAMLSKELTPKKEKLKNDVAAISNNYAAVAKNLDKNLFDASPAKAAATETEHGQHEKALPSADVVLGAEDDTYSEEDSNTNDISGEGADLGWIYETHDDEESDTDK